MTALRPQATAPTAAKQPCAGKRGAWLLALLLAGCGGDSRTEATAAEAGAQAIRGWYVAGRLQPCGEPARVLRDAAALDAALLEQDMDEGSPVFVRVEVAPAADGDRLLRIVQVGSPTPVRDCPMTGTSTP